SSDWLDMYWRHGSAIGTRPSRGMLFSVAPAEWHRVRQLAECLEKRDAPRVLAITRDVVGGLRAQGLPLESEALRETADEAAWASDFARVLWQVCGRLSQQPMAVDLCRSLRLSERHALRRARQHIERFHMSASSWREFMNCLRLEMGAFFMSAP